MKILTNSSAMCCMTWGNLFCVHRNLTVAGKEKGHAKTHSKTSDLKMESYSFLTS